LRRGCWGGSLQSESPSDSAGRQTGFLIGEPIGQELTCVDCGHSQIQWKAHVSPSSEAAGLLAQLAASK
jgi:hypothetical protein